MLLAEADMEETEEKVEAQLIPKPPPEVAEVLEETVALVINVAVVEAVVLAAQEVMVAIIWVAVAEVSFLPEVALVHLAAVKEKDIVQGAALAVKVLLAALVRPVFVY